MTKIKQRSLDFLVAKSHATLQLLLRGWAVQDVLIGGGPDLLAIKHNRVARIKVRYGVKGFDGWVFSSGGYFDKTFFEVSAGNDFLVLVCLGASRQPNGFYIFSRETAPKTKTLFHPETGPHPRYKNHFDNWDVLGVST